MGKIKWTFEKVKEEALNFDSKVDFMKKSNGIYRAAYRNKWLDEVCSHMTKGLK